jgi:glycosyltransferase involved in cell wall biosynthesis
MDFCLTVGVTTHNEVENIAVLLDRLLLLPKSRIQIVLYDDGSTDGTASLIAQHPLAHQGNFQARLADVNFGSPSIGRRYIAERANSPYITFIDGDDLIDPKALAAVAEQLAPGFDIIMTPFVLGRQITFVRQFDNKQPISNATIIRLLSGIAGKIYNREAVYLHAEDPIKGRSEDVRLNMRILLAGFDRVRIEDVRPFYYIESSRKSTYAKNILSHELSARVANYQILKARYGLDDIYIKNLHKNLLEVVQRDPTLTDSDRVTRRRAIHDAMSFKLKNIIHVIEDISGVNFAAKVNRDLVAVTDDRSIRHIWIALRGNAIHSAPNTHWLSPDLSAISSVLGGCSSAETVVIVHDDSIKRFPQSIRNRLFRWPLIQMRWTPLVSRFQDAQSHNDFEAADSFNISRVVSVMKQDVILYKQNGIWEVTGIKIPIRVRDYSSYDASSNKCLSYILSDDCCAEELNFLMELAKKLRERGLSSLNILFTGGEQSLVLSKLTTLLSHVGASDVVTIQCEIADRQAFYGRASIVILPPTGETHGRLALEAFSFGVPVIAPSYAPGVAEIIRDKNDGFLLDEFSGEAIASLLERLSPKEYVPLSRSCFSRHHDFSVEQYVASIEKIASDVACEFPGENRVRFIPHLSGMEPPETRKALLAPLMKSYARRKLHKLRGKAVEVVVFLRFNKPLRWIRQQVKLVSR